jgi:hypothetical protein
VTRRFGRVSGFATISIHTPAKGETYFSKKTGIIVYPQLSLNVSGFH